MDYAGGFCITLGSCLMFLPQDVDYLHCRVKEQPVLFGGWGSLGPCLVERRFFHIIILDCSLVLQFSSKVPRDCYEV